MILANHKLLALNLVSGVKVYAFVASAYSKVTYGEKLSFI